MLALLLAGCGPCERRPEQGTAGPTGWRPPARIEQAREGPSLPEPGSAVVELSERGVTVLANAAPRLEVLRLLETQAGFLVVLGRVDEPAPVTLWAVELPLEAVLSQVLEGLAYENRYQADPERGGHLLTTVAVGSFPTAEASGGPKERRAKRRELRAQKRAEASRRLAELSPEEREWQREQREARRRDAETRLAREIEDTDARVRAEAAGRVKPEGEGQQLLEELLAEDLSPEVRAAAARRLAGGDSYATVGALLQSLNDPSPEVVIAALEALEFVGDESILPEILKLMNHPDPEVRAAAMEAKDFIE
jgi:hypothetical protein